MITSLALSCSAGQDNEDDDEDNDEEDGDDDDEEGEGEEGEGEARGDLSSAWEMLEVARNLFIKVKPSAKPPPWLSP